jgi:acyl carrier protein
VNGVQVDVDARIRGVLDTHARLGAPAAGLDTGDDLYAAGMTSHASVNVMLALEDAFDIEFPDELLNKSTFCTLQSLGQAVLRLTHAVSGQSLTHAVSGVEPARGVHA